MRGAQKVHHPLMPSLNPSNHNLLEENVYAMHAAVLGTENKQEAGTGASIHLISLTETQAMPGIEHSQTKQAFLELAA